QVRLRNLPRTGRSQPGVHSWPTIVVGRPGCTRFRSVAVMKDGLRGRKREATRTSIWQSAMRLFAERGYDEVTVEEIADVCELSPRTFFRYFGTKEAVLFAGTELRRAIFLDALADQPADARPFEAIEGASRALAVHYEPDREALRTRARIVEAAPSLRSRNAGFSPEWDHDVREQL